MSKRISIEFTDDQFDLLQKKAKQNGLSIEMFLTSLALQSTISRQHKRPDDDSFTRWVIDEQLKEGNEFHHRIYSSDLYRYYIRYCEDKDLEPVTHALFSRLMSGTGIPKQRDYLGVYFRASTFTMETEIQTAKIRGLPPSPPRSAIVR